jgi:PKD repeat protein
MSSMMRGALNVVVVVAVATGFAACGGGNSMTQPSQLPVADAGGPYAGNAGTSIVFNGMKSYAPKGIQSYEWAFGDGGTGTGITPTHTYLKAPTTSATAIYTVTLTITDTAGSKASASTSATITQTY